MMDEMTNTRGRYDAATWDDDVPLAVSRLMTYVTSTPFAAMMTFTRNVQKMSSITAAPLLAIPFDMMREQYAAAVRAGLVRISLLESSRFGRLVTDLERCTLGPLARHM